MLKKSQSVAAGRGFDVRPESTAIYYQRANVARTPIADIAPTEVPPAWMSGRYDPFVSEFVELARAACGGSGPTKRPRAISRWASSTTEPPIGGCRFDAGHPLGCCLDSDSPAA